MARNPLDLWVFCTILNLIQVVHFHFHLLPLVNPTGFRVNRRYNLMGQNPNSGFCHDYGNSPSIERDMLLRHFNMIINASRDAFVSLHEDIDEDRFYVYSFENSVTTGKFTKSLVSILSSFFNQFQMA